MFRRAAVVSLICVSAAVAEAGQSGGTTAAGFILTPRHLTISVPLVDGHDLQFKRMLAPGLSQTRVAQILQDDKGFMWFGTQNGLHRYDGYSLKVFRHDPQRSSSLSGVFIYSLLRDRAGALWVGSDDGIDRFNPVTETFERFAVEGVGSNPTNVSGISQDSAGTLWLSTLSGLYRLDSAAHRTTTLRHDPRDASTVSSSVIQFVGEDAGGDLWVATSAGLDLLDRTTQKVVRHLPLPDSQRALVFRQDRHGNFWIIHGAEGRLSVFDRSANELSEWRPASGADARPVSFNTMLEDRDGTMWFGTLNQGILKFDRDHGRFVRYMPHASDPNSLSDRRVNVLYQDKEGLIWAGLHQAAPNYFLPRPPAFQRLQSTARPSSLVSMVLHDRSGLVWLGLDRGIMTLDRASWTYAEHPLFRSDETTSMVESPPGVFWIGTAGQGLRRYDRHTERITSYRHHPAVSGSLPSDFVEQVKLDHNGDVWAVTWRGLARWDPAADRFVTFLPKNAPIGLTLHTVTFGHSGVIWIGSNLGLHRVEANREHVEWFRHDRTRAGSLSNDRVNAIHEARDGSIWIGTQNGLDHWDRNARPIRRYTDADGLAGNTVSCILEDEVHRLWISTNRGISRLDSASGQFVSYGTADGLPGVNMTGWGSCSQAESGEMFFAGFAGAAAFVPAHVVERSYMPPPVLTDLRLLDAASSSGNETFPPRAISYATGITLLPFQDKFSIEFAALSFLSPETNRFRYRLQGLQDEWTEVGSDQRVATFMALPAGTYAFQLQGAAGHGPWSDAVATLQIVMLPPWWNTWALYACVGLAATGALTTAYRLRVRQLSRAYNARLEERWAERTRIARELHDTLLQSFQGLMFRLQTVRNLLPARPDEAIAVLDPALLHGDDAIDEARSAVDGLRASEKVVRDLESGLAAVAIAMADICQQAQPPSWTVVATGRPQEVRRAVLYELYQVAQEALRNAFRHARSSRIAVELQYRIGELRISVTDDGVGFDDEAEGAEPHPRHWGLQGMRERVERLGGQLSIRSRAGNGTVVSIVVPAALVYRRSAWLGTIARRLSWPPQARSETRD